MTTDLNRFIYEFTGITMGLNWITLASLSPEIKVLKINDNQQLGQFFTPWRRKSDGTYADGWDRSAEPLRVNTNPFPPCLESNLQSFSWQNSPLRLPCYQISNGEYLILDGNHRAVCLHRLKIPFEVQAWVIAGPLDSNILPDLGKWQQ